MVDGATGGGGGGAAAAVVETTTTTTTRTALRELGDVTLDLEALADALLPRGVVRTARVQNTTATVLHNASRCIERRRRRRACLSHGGSGVVFTTNEGLRTTVLHDDASSPHALFVHAGELTRLAYEVCAAALLGGGRPTTSSSSSSPSGDRDGSREDGTASFSYTVRNHPLPLTAAQSLEIRAIVSFFAAAFVLVPYCYMPAAFVAVVVGEMECRAHAVQRASGASRAAYWAAHYAWDALGHALLTLALLATYGAFATSSFQVFAGTARAAAATAALTLAYGAAALPLGYCCAPLFESRASAQVGCPPPPRDTRTQRHARAIRAGSATRARRFHDVTAITTASG